MERNGRNALGWDFINYTLAGALALLRTNIRSSASMENDLVTHQRRALMREIEMKVCFGSLSYRSYCVPEQTLERDEKGSRKDIK